jgi:hypothetical protein
MLVTHNLKSRVSHLLKFTPRAFSTQESQNQAATPANEPEVIDQVRARIDPVKGEVQDFLKHISVYEE